jgi:hypothetical protein
VHVSGWGSWIRHHVVVYLQTKDGIPTTVTFGFVRSLLALLEQEQPDALVVVFDAPGGTTFRSGHARVKHCRAGQGKAGQGRTGQGRARRG